LEPEILEDDWKKEYSLNLDRTTSQDSLLDEGNPMSSKSLQLDQPLSSYHEKQDTNSDPDDVYDTCDDEDRSRMRGKR